MGDGKMKQGGSSGSGKGGATFFLRPFPVLFFSFLFTFLRYKVLRARYLPSPPCSPFPAGEEIPSLCLAAVPRLPLFSYPPLHS